MMEGQTARMSARAVCKRHTQSTNSRRSRGHSCPSEARGVARHSAGRLETEPCVLGQEGSWEAGLSQQLNERGWLPETSRKSRSEMPPAAAGSVLVLRTRAAAAPQVASDGSFVSLASRWADVPASTARFTCQIRCPHVLHAHLSLLAVENI